MNKKKVKVGQLGTLLALLLLCLIIILLTGKPFENHFNLIQIIKNSTFIKIPNLMNLLKQTTLNSLLAVGMLLCLMTAGIDLSVGANATFCSCIMGAMVVGGVKSGVIMMLVGLIAGTLVGCCNGLLLTKLHLPHPFVSTLGVKNVLWGLALLVTGSRMINGYPASAEWFGKETIAGGFPVGFILVIIIYVIMHIFLSKTALGRSIYCVGGNIEATRLSGINTDNVLIFCYTMSGLMSAIAGIYLVGRNGMCNGASAANPYDTDAIAACIIGGASFSGGKGTMAGTMLGCLIIAVLRNGFTLLSIPSSVQNVVLGLVIILAVLMDVIRASMEKKARMQAAAKAAQI